jgi:hypothetical protein
MHAEELFAQAMHASEFALSPSAETSTNGMGSENAIRLHVYTAESASGTAWFKIAERHVG